MDKRIIVSIVIISFVGIVFGYFLMETEIRALQDQVVQGNNQIQSLQQEVNSLNQSYIALQHKFEDLLFHDLNITLVLQRSTYFYKDSEPVFGWVTITYLNGTAFRGAFTIYIRGIEGNTTTGSILIDGTQIFILSWPVFRFGPGPYTIGIGSLSTADGYIFRWQVFPSVQVEPQLS
jgi:type II secretory pathway pseudopilin PulG